MKNYIDSQEHWEDSVNADYVYKKTMEKELVRRYGEDWKNVKVKECMYRNDEYTDEGLNSVDIDKYGSSWMAWNNNGCLFNGKEWAEVLEEKRVATNLSDIGRPYYIDSFGAAGKTDEFKTITKNHMTSKELCEGILALQQLISFRDDFHKVHGKPTTHMGGAIYLVEGEFKHFATGRGSFRIGLFKFKCTDQAEEFLKTHEDLFNELKKLF